MKDWQHKIDMFCFQTPFTRASRVLVSSLSSNKTKTSSMSMILPVEKTSGSKCDRQDSEATSEGSGSSIGYIDQEPLVSDTSSTDSTLPDIKADYLDPETLSPGPDSLTAPTSVVIVENGMDEPSNDILAEDNEQNYHVTLSSSSPEKQSYSNRRSKRLLLRLRSSDSSSNNKEDSLDTVDDSIEAALVASSKEEEHRDKEKDYKSGETLLTSSSPSVLIDSADPEEEEDALRNSRITAASENDISSLQNVFSESEKENVSNQETETETEEGSSLPLSPAGPSTAGLSSSTVPYYNFLCVNGGSMRQEMTSTSSPQLSSDSNHRSSAESSSPADACSSFNVEKNSRLDTLKPESLESTFCLPAARSCPNLERQSAGCSPTSGSFGSSPSPGPVGPRFKPIEEGDIQVCFLNYTNLVKKILSSKYLRRWETHHLYLNDTCISSKTVSLISGSKVFYKVRFI